MEEGSRNVIGTVAKSCCFELANSGVWPQGPFDTATTASRSREKS